MERCVYVHPSMALVLRTSMGAENKGIYIELVKQTYTAELLKVQYMFRLDSAQMKTKLRRCYYLYIARPPKQLSSFVREEICTFSIKVRTLRFDTCNVKCRVAWDRNREM